MDPNIPEAAQRIVAEYAALLESQTERNVYPALISDLPYPKDTIKSAIHTCVGVLAANRQLTAELGDFLEVAYLSLADYVEDEVAQLLREYRNAGEALALDGRQARDKMASPAWSVVSESSRLAGVIARAIAEETERLRREFNVLRSSCSVGEDRANDHAHPQGEHDNSG